MVAATVDVTPDVPIVKLVDVPPAGMATDVGTEAPEAFDERATVIPPVGAGPFRLTVPLAEAPPITEFGEMIKLDSVAGLMVSDAV